MRNGLSRSSSDQRPTTFPLGSNSTTTSPTTLAGPALGMGLVSLAGYPKMTLTVEDPLFLREPASYTTQWLPAPEGYKLRPYECDPEAARHPIKFLVPKYK